MYSFHYTIKEKKHYGLLIFKGRLMDHSLHEEIKKKADELISGGFKTLIADLTELEYMNSMGLNLLIQLQTKVRIAEGQMILVGPNSKISELIQLTKLNSLFKIFPSLKEAEEFLEK
ncbi:MAG: STAS domain-containing protein [Bacteroidia bacterium]|nr:STAS domain-containing protein [Bacteroidia bacterium]